MLGVIHSEQYRWLADMHGISPAPPSAVRGKAAPGIDPAGSSLLVIVEDWYFPSAFSGESTTTGTQQIVVRCRLLSDVS